MSLTEKVDEKAISDEIATQDEDETAAITLVRIKSFSVASEADKDKSNSISRPQTIPEEQKNNRGESIPLITQNSKEADKQTTDVDKQTTDADKQTTTDADKQAGDPEKQEANQDRQAPTNKPKNDRVRKTDAHRPGRVSLQEEPFQKSKVPRKSVLKHRDIPLPRTQSTYDSTTATSASPTTPPSSPSVVSDGGGSEEGARSPVHHDQKCCSIM